MKLRRFLITGLAVALIALAALANSTRAQALVPERVYIALSKDAIGPAQSRLLKKYECDTPFGVKPMMKVLAYMSLKVTPHDCDEYPREGKLLAKWLIIVRTDGVHFGTHAGPFKWTDTDGNVWVGSMHGTIGCGTHRPPYVGDCEECRVQNHFEGCLDGRAIAGPLYDRYKSLGLPAPLINATYAGYYDGTLPSITGIKMAIDGVHVLWCHD